MTHVGFDYIIVPFRIIHHDDDDDDDDTYIRFKVTLFLDSNIFNRIVSPIK